MEQAQELTISVGDHAQFQRKFNESSIATKINHWQCRYLRKKLEKAIESVRSAHFPYLEPLFYGEHEESTPDYTAIELEIFKVLYALAKEVENFIKSCCKDAWSQAALTLSNVSDHVLSIAFNLELWTILYSESKSKKLIARARQSFTIAEVDKIYKTEVEKMKKKAFQDRENLLIKLDAELYTKKETSMEYQLAAFLLHRLESRISPGCMPVVGFQRITSGESGELPSSGSQSGLSLKVFGSLRQSGILGKGSAATVYKAKWLGGKVAMKTFYGAGNHFFKKEVSILRGLSHPNIISLLWSTVDRRKCSIIVERMDGDLHTLMQVRLEGRGDQESPFCILEAVDIMLQVGGGMLYLHEMKIVHRDLKSTNILVKHVREHNPEIEYFQVKVADFGLSKTKEKSVTYSNQTINMGTPRWMAPEMIKTLDNASGSSGTDARTMKFPFKCDVYSFGMVCYEILTGEIPFSSITNLVDVKKTVLDVKKTVLDGGRPTLPEECPTLLEALIEKCWTQDACQRPCFGQICAKLRHLKCLLLLSCKYFFVGIKIAFIAYFNANELNFFDLKDCL
jgi:hypothetical protein